MHMADPNPTFFSEFDYSYLINFLFLNLLLVNHLSITLKRLITAPYGVRGDGISCHLASLRLLIALRFLLELCFNHLEEIPSIFFFFFTIKV